MKSLRLETDDYRRTAFKNIGTKMKASITDIAKTATLLAYFGYFAHKFRISLSQRSELLAFVESERITKISGIC